MLPATTFRSSRSSAITPTLPPALMTAALNALEPSAMNASVVTLMTGTPAWTLTDAVPPNPPPTTSEVIVSFDFALTITLPLTVR